MGSGTLIPKVDDASSNLVVRSNDLGRAVWHGPFPFTCTIQVTQHTIAGVYGWRPLRLGFCFPIIV